MNMENTGSIPSVSSDTSALPAIDDGHLEGLEKGSAALLVRSGPQRNERFILSGQKVKCYTWCNTLARKCNTLV